MARLYSAKVHGIDLSKNMVSIATEYQREMEESVRENVSFESLPFSHLKFVNISPFQRFLSRLVILPNKSLGSEVLM